jgi:4-amino-4-deoxy-L-arabinose transferase-like glycosyltransferase
MGIRLADTYEMGLLVAVVGAGLLALSVRRLMRRRADVLTVAAILSAAFCVGLGLRIAVDRTESLD